MHRFFRVFGCVSMMTLLAVPTDAQQAQDQNAWGLAGGLIRSIPAEGKAVRFEGKVTQINARPDRPDREERLEWIKHLTIKCLNSEEAVFRGRKQPCRWIEIVVITGERSEGGIDGGPIGSRIYKLLIPEAVIDGKKRDSANVPFDMLPIVKGWKKLGRLPVKKIRSRAVRVYPIVSSLGHYKNARIVAANEDPGAPFGPVNALHAKGSMIMERRTSRSTNTADYWVSKDVPFGLVSWNITTVRESKDVTDDRAKFEKVSEVKIEMSLHKIEDQAASEIVVPGQQQAGRPGAVRRR